MKKSILFLSIAVLILTGSSFAEDWIATYNFANPSDRFAPDAGSAVDAVDLRVFDIAPFGDMDWIAGTDTINSQSTNTLETNTGGRYSTAHAKFGVSGLQFTANSPSNGGGSNINEYTIIQDMKCDWTSQSADYNYVSFFYIWHSNETDNQQMAYIDPYSNGVDAPPRSFMWHREAAATLADPPLGADSGDIYRQWSDESTNDPWSDGAPVLQNGVYNRIALVVNVPTQDVSYYVDGTLAWTHPGLECQAGDCTTGEKPSSTQFPVDGVYSLIPGDGSTQAGNVFMNPIENPAYCTGGFGEAISSLGFVDRAMTDFELLALGGPDADGIQPADLVATEMSGMDVDWSVYK